MLPALVTWVEFKACIQIQMVRVFDICYFWRGFAKETIYRFFFFRNMNPDVPQSIYRSHNGWFRWLFFGSNLSVSDWFTKMVLVCLNLAAFPYGATNSKNFNRMFNSVECLIVVSPILLRPKNFLFLHLLLMFLRLFYALTLTSIVKSTIRYIFIFFFSRLMWPVLNAEWNASAWIVFICSVCIFAVNKIATHILS